MPVQTLNSNLHTISGGHNGANKHNSVIKHNQSKEFVDMKKAFATTLAAVAVFATVAGVASGSSVQSNGAGAKNVVQTAVAAGKFKTLVKLVQAAGLAGALSGPGPLTLFAPTDAAFAKVPAATLKALGKNKAKLKKVLLYHVVAGKVTAAQVVKLKSAKTLEGSSVAIHVRGGKVDINNAQVTTPDDMASNGVIHIINNVLIPAS
jgi:uncharacterized surface protein with fasciclin (FAS1) repeats